MNILDQIVATKRREVAQLLPRAGQLRHAVAARKDYRDFAAALRSAGRPALIAEIKKASPSAGILAPNFDPVVIARQYQVAGAAALSVLTDEEYFQGKLDYLRQVREAVPLPLLRKDFIIDELQIYEAAAGGADAVLLIAAILDDRQLRDYRGLAEHLKLAALVEVHDEAELDRALAAGAQLIGINNRNLRDFSVSLQTTERLCACLRGSNLPVATRSGGTADRGQNAPPAEMSDLVIVAESGIHTRADVERVAAAGAHAILVGESLMRSGNPADKVKELLGW